MFCFYLLFNYYISKQYYENLKKKEKLEQMEHVEILPPIYLPVCIVLQPFSLWEKWKHLIFLKTNRINKNIYAGLQIYFMCV